MATAIFNREPSAARNVPAPPTLKFNLSLAMAGEPLITRDGHLATRFTVSEDRQTNYPIRAVVDGRERSFTIAGTYWIGRPDPYDLFIASPQESR